MKTRLAILVVLLACGGAVAATYAPTGLGFTAPTIEGKGNVHSPKTGEIVYDSSDKKFYGYSQDGVWLDLSSVVAAVVPPGTVLPFGGPKDSTPPSGYLFADGSAVSRTEYTELFEEIGTAFGEGDGSTTFNLPDLRGRFIRGVDGGQGNDPDSSSRYSMNSGGNSGDAVGSVQDGATARPSTDFATNITGEHTHGPGSLRFSGRNIGSSTGGSAPGFVQDAGTLRTQQLDSGTTDASGDHSHIVNQGGDNETRPVNAYLNFIIKY